jgi:hypothetical protein
MILQVQWYNDGTNSQRVDNARLKAGMFIPELADNMPELTKKERLAAVAGTVETG